MVCGVGLIDNLAISQLLNISENTDKNHVQRIMAKLGASFCVQAVAMGLMQGVILIINRNRINYPLPSCD